jgi:hypothetical protein
MVTWQAEWWIMMVRAVTGLSKARDMMYHELGDECIAMTGDPQAVGECDERACTGVAGRGV